MYLIKTPWWLRALYPTLTWRMPAEEKAIYLSFDDGPHPVATPFVLEQLDRFNAKASFFCIGKNVAEYPGIYQDILGRGHSTGNHTYHHVNGWKTDLDTYWQDYQQAQQLIHSNLFRPPYGRITRSQIKKIQSPNSRLQTSDSSLPTPPARIIMWDVLSGDFDLNLSPEACLNNVLRHTRAGSIVLFHDSEKAWPRMKYALPAMLEYFLGEGFVFREVPVERIA